MAMGRSFVAGATGYTGGALVRVLVAHGAEVVAHIRPDSPRLEEHRARFASLGADVDDTAWDEDAMAETLRRTAPDAVFALLGTTKKRGDSYEEVDYGLNALLMRATARARPLARFVYLSVADVSPSKTSPYIRARARLEAELRQTALPWTIVRPSWISGSDRSESRPGERVGVAVTNVAMAFAGIFGGRRLRQRYSSITADELAAALAEIAFSEAHAHCIVESEELKNFSGIDAVRD